MQIGRRSGSLGRAHFGGVSGGAATCADSHLQDSRACIWPALGRNPGLVGFIVCRQKPFYVGSLRRALKVVIVALDCGKHSFEPLTASTTTAISAPFLCLRTTPAQRWTDAVGEGNARGRFDISVPAGFRVHHG